NPLSSVLFAGGKEETIDNSSWEWSLKGASTKPLVVLENTNSNAITQPGRFKSTFLLKLDENWWKPGDVIHPGTSNKKYQCRVQEMPYRHGNGFSYVLRLMDDNPTAFLPLQYLSVGQQWAKLYSQYEEAG